MGKKFLGFVLMSFMLMFLLTACGGETAGEHVGSWVSIEHYLGGERVEDLEGETITFNEDGTAETSFGTGNYVIEDENIVFTSEQDETVTYVMEDDKLIVETFITEIIYEKVEE